MTDHIQDQIAAMAALEAKARLKEYQYSPKPLARFDADIRVAYRMLGSLSEAEDMVQEVWLRWQTQDTAGDAKPDMSVERENWLTKAFTLMQETLKPVERAVFLLREVFEYDYTDTAAIVVKPKPTAGKLSGGRKCSYRRIQRRCLNQTNRRAI